MSSLLNSEDVSYRTGILMRHFETFSSGRYLVVHKAPTKTVQNVSSNPIPGYGPSSNESNITYSYISGVFPAMAVFDKQTFERQITDFQTQIPSTKTKIKVTRQTRDFIVSGKNEYFEFDGMKFQEALNETPQYYLGLYFYYFTLDRAT